MNDSDTPTPREVSQDDFPSDLRVPQSQIGKKRGVVGVIIREERFLVIRRSHLVTAPGKLCLPGGTMEQGETETQTLVREMKEELNLDVSPLGLCWRSVTPWGTSLAWWRADIDTQAVPTPDPAEVSEYFWMTADDIQNAKNTLPSLPAFVAAIGTGEITL